MSSPLLFRRFVVLRATALVLLLVFGVLIHNTAAQSVEQPIPPARRTSIRILSFNIRFGTANDGPNHWSQRRDAVVNLIREVDPDLMGVQESLALQTDFLQEQLPAYGLLGAGRDDGKRAGEMTAVFYRRDRFRKLDGGHFWLSEQPEAVASRSWDSSLTRMATWVRLQDLRDSGQREFVFLNTHFDHQGEQARVESSRLLRRKLKSLSQQASVIVSGDFNADEGSQPYQELLAEPDSTLPLVDTYRRIHPLRASGEGTFSNFRPDPVRGPRIDWILVSSNWRVLSAEIERRVVDGRIPSDHFPVQAEVDWPKGQDSER